MTPDEIRDKAVARFNEFAPVKYDIGQAEHGGLLHETVTIQHLEEEVVDLWFYVQALKIKLNNGKVGTGEERAPADGLSGGDDDRAE